MDTRHGTVEYKGKTLALTQEPYIDYSCSLGGDAYYAGAQDESGRYYKLQWEIIDEDNEDESEACNWEVFSVVDEWED